jgi:hypothetical protein
MKRNSTTLFLESPNATTPVPWVDGAPDLSGFTEPTLSVLQQSWADFLASGQELEVIPDPEPSQPTPAPDWDGFLTPFYTPAGAGNGSPHDILETKVQRCFLVASRITDQTERETAQAAALSLQRHWSNCIIGLTNKDIRASNGWLGQNWQVLKEFFNAAVALLPPDQQEICNLTPEETMSIEALFANFNLL